MVVPVSDDAEPRDTRGAFARRLLPMGSEPDPRFTLANERTFLAWIRTALALMAGGIAVEAFTSDIFAPAVRQSVAILLLVLGMLLSGGAFVRWVGVERAMRRQAPLPLPLIAPVLGMGGAVAAAVVASVIFTRGP